MEDLIFKALDTGGVLALALAILVAGGRRLDKIDVKLGKLLQLTALGFSSDGKKAKVQAILDEKK